MPQKTSIFGLGENLAAALSYIFGPISGIIVLVAERENKFVRFHALQSTLWFLFLMVTGWVLGFIIGLITSIPLLGWLIGIILSPFTLVAVIFYIVSKVFLILKALSGSTYKIPIVGDVVWTQIHR